jgi:hydrogenase maturation protease
VSGPPSAPLRPGTTVLGIGNPIMGDDGVGIALLGELMAAGLERPVEFVDGGTIGMSLLPLVEDTGSLLILDAVAGDGPPGTLVHLTGDQLPRLIRAKISAHQVGLLDALAGARLRATEPDRIAVVGLIPAHIDIRVGLSPVVAASVGRAVELARTILRDWWRADDARAASLSAEPADEARATGWGGHQ